MEASKDSLGRAFTKLFLSVILVGVALGFVDYFFKTVIPWASEHGIPYIKFLEGYRPYVIMLVAVALGWLVISYFAKAIYLTLLPKYGHPTATAMRSVVKIVGLGGLLAGVAGGSTGSAVGVALGGFMGMVVGFASQQVLGQAIAGVFLLLSRPIKIDDVVDIAGEKKVKVLDITPLFTVVRRETGEIVLIPNNSLIGQKIVKHKSA